MLKHSATMPWPAHHDAVHELEVRRIRREHHAERLPRRGRVLVRVAHVVLHIAAARRECGRPRLVELGEDLLQVLADDVREHIEAPAVRHAERELTDAERGARLEHAVEERNQRLAAFEAEALLADIAVREEVLEAVGLEELRQDALLGVGAELRAVARPFDALRDPRAALGGLDVHVLDAHRAAVGLLEARDDVGERRGVVERERARIERLAEGFVVEADRLEGEVLGERTRGAERIELRREVAVGAVAVDQIIHFPLRERTSSASSTTSATSTTSTRGSRRSGDRSNHGSRRSGDRSNNGALRSLQLEAELEPQEEVLPLGSDRVRVGFELREQGFDIVGLPAVHRLRGVGVRTVLVGTRMGHLVHSKLCDSPRGIARRQSMPMIGQNAAHFSVNGG